MESQHLPETYLALTAKEDAQEPKLQNLPLPKPGSNQVLVKIAFVPINPADVYCMKGVYRLSPQSPYLVGLEASGTVAAVGENLNRSFKVGDRVHVYAAGTIAQYVLVDTEYCSLILGDLSFEEAASHITNPATVAYMLALTERSGNKAAINTAASSALGRMFIRYFKEKGFKTINIVRNDKYIEELKKEGDDYVLNSEWPDFETKLKEIINKEQTTISFDATNALYKKFLKNSPPNSLCYIYGILEGGTFEDLTTTKIENGKTGLLYKNYLDEFKEKGELDKFYNEIHSRLTTTFKTSIQKVFLLEEIFQAIDFYEKNSSKGKVLIKPN